MCFEFIFYLVGVQSKYHTVCVSNYFNTICGYVYIPHSLCFKILSTQSLFKCMYHTYYVSTSFYTDCLPTICVASDWDWLCQTLGKLRWIKLPIGKCVIYWKTCYLSENKLPTEKICDFY